ncbi:efflux RND transporter periplasmic adaptor subunit [Xanthobacter aminoxidans]|uniref:efflux RND transporter periplasmic adaptor subunit n=1 Tax=Xanthobacter aminoxidans TaxID=186280 RepID=UPI00202316E5|nr:efflux RND transporter periplasmic adaptor subunit [Xanthobacter aminoxidans]MCL8382860.1 efflux RND transporter periplasmic adaptor subunit [Xanthobacter aminoxidans]
MPRLAVPIRSGRHLKGMAALLLAGSALLIAGCGQENPANAGEAPASREATLARPVQVTTVSFRPRQTQKSFVGVVRARREIDLAFRVGGKVVQRLVEVGDRIEPGTVVARLDREDLKLELESAKAEMQAATANLAQTTTEDTRYRALTAKGAASNADLDRKSLAKDEAVGRLERAKRSLELAENRLSYADLVTDAAGVVVATSAEPGQVVASGQTIVRVARLDEKEALVSLPETALADARTADAVVTLWADPGRRIPARLRELSPQADATSRTYPARFTLDGADETVALGMTATVTLRPKDQQQVARLPLSALIDRGHGPQVFVVDGATHAIVARPVEIAAYTGDEVLLSGGVAPGDAVVILGVQTLLPGQKVRTVQAPSVTEVAERLPSVETRRAQAPAGASTLAEQRP